MGPFVFKSAAYCLLLLSTEAPLSSPHLFFNFIPVTDMNDKLPFYSNKKKESKHTKKTQKSNPPKKNTTERTCRTRPRENTNLACLRMFMERRSLIIIFLLALRHSLYPHTNPRSFSYLSYSLYYLFVTHSFFIYEPSYILSTLTYVTYIYTYNFFFLSFLFFLTSFSFSSSCKKPSFFLFITSSLLILFFSVRQGRGPQVCLSLWLIEMCCTSREGTQDWWPRIQKKKTSSMCHRGRDSGSRNEGWADEAGIGRLCFRTTKKLANHGMLFRWDSNGFRAVISGLQQHLVQISVVISVVVCIRGLCSNIDTRFLILFMWCYQRVLKECNAQWILNIHIQQGFWWSLLWDVGLKYITSQVELKMKEPQRRPVNRTGTEVEQERKQDWTGYWIGKKTGQERATKPDWRTGRRDVSTINLMYHPSQAVIILQICIIQIFIAPAKEILCTVKDHEGIDLWSPFNDLDIFSFYVMITLRMWIKALLVSLHKCLNPSPLQI
ncbi:putative signal peptide protein [Puccinia sorghi]|uniref:Putative signal peptide protein n=1 Tax=Puccinia sorghi TaxID=27349 RepID=A0A0L6U7C9_9BASI|nr:putative signal peptide protein [Puccinia sorghi]